MTVWEIALVFGALVLAGVAIIGSELVASGILHGARLSQCTAAGFSDSVCQPVARGDVWIGMPARLARIGWGSPCAVNRTVTRSGVWEQWVYRDDRCRGFRMRFLYFQDGILVTIQD